MADVFTETTHESWFSRIGNSLKGLIIGLILFVISFPVLFWNEGRAVKTAKSLNEGESVTVSVASDAIDPANEGKLVHTTGMATTEDVLRDELFGIESNAIRLTRVAEMYQWKENKKTKTKKKIGGGTRKTTEYTYNKTWSAQRIDSDRFKKSAEHKNPGSMAIKGKSSEASNVTLGAFHLPGDLTSRISGSESIAIAEANIPEQHRESMSVNGSEELYLGTDPQSPQIGDIRVRFQSTPASGISVLAQQVNDSFRPYQTEAGRALSMLEMGKHDAAEMFQHARSQNSMFTWVLRAVGAGMMFGGLMMLMAPLAVLGDVIPIIGSIISGGSFIVAALITLVFAPLTIGIAWVFYRPLIGIPIMLVSVVGLVLLFNRRKAEPLPEVMPVEG